MVSAKESEREWVNTHRSFSIVNIYAEQQQQYHRENEILWMSHRNINGSIQFTQSIYLFIRCIHACFLFHFVCVCVRARLRLLAFFDTSSNTANEELRSICEMQSKYYFHFFVVAVDRFVHYIPSTNKQPRSPFISFSLQVLPCKHKTGMGKYIYTYISFFFTGVYLIL